ncbi:acyl-CoA dehydrogenase family protein [Halorientalis brevis]|uniref:Acyl-CoA dehydrogenase family protein n=1 Tax=Halorientalis brevis TaxID=1126241 RepID=A0ABD6C917_9EURY|nr:acyl-CoA dehydrogenase family protein [Halorientalis brevis]
MSYLNLDTEYESGDVERLRKEVHEIAREELRPVGREIDRMSDDEYQRIAADDSPYWDVMRTLKSHGYHRAIIPEAVGGGGQFSGREFHVLLEELAWGDPGLAMAFGVDLIPAIFASLPFQNGLDETYLQPYLEDEDAAVQGCWGVTEPDHGSELVMPNSLLSEGVTDGGSIARTQARAEQDGDTWILNGEKARWLSAGPMATHCALHVNMDPDGGSPGLLCLVELDQPGVEQGDPIGKLGQRGCPQGNLVFDDVEIPPENVILTPEMLHPDTGYVSMDQILCITSAGMAAACTGLARAAFEEALAYARERAQGGKPICEHQSVKLQLYELFETVETMRTYSRAVVEHVWERNLETFEFDASSQHALAAQVYCKRAAFEVANTAVQIHGGNGITHDYLVEKLFRDARVKLIEDGTTEVLSLEAAEDVVENYEIE